MATFSSHPALPTLATPLDYTSSEAYTAPAVLAEEKADRHRKSSATAKGEATDADTMDFIKGKSSTRHCHIVGSGLCCCYSDTALRKKWCVPVPHPPAFASSSSYKLLFVRGSLAGSIVLQASHSACPRGTRLLSLCLTKRSSG